MKERTKDVITIVALMIITCVICMLCYSNKFSKVGMWTDSSVFTYIAERMQEGEQPYKDWFDHKGPILYIINFIGINIKLFSINGIWFIEYISILITIIFTQKILRKVFGFNIIESIILNFVININIVLFLEGGNFTEEYALPIITITLYLILTINQYNLKKSNFLIGMLLGIIVGLRANMISIWCAYYIIVLIKCVKQKEVKKLLDIILFSFLGFISVIGLLILYLIKNGILMDCIKDYFIFNFHYSMNQNKSVLQVILYYLVFTNFEMYILIIIFEILAKKNNKFKMFSILFTIITFIIVIQPRNLYMHYGLILVPTFIIPLANIYNYIKEKSNNVVILIGIGLMVLIIPISSYIDTFIYTNIIQEKNNEKDELSNYIINNSEITDKIIVIGNDCEIYLLTDRESASKYMFQNPIYKIDNGIIDKVVEDIMINEPKYIIITEKQITETLKNKVLSRVNEKYMIVKEWENYLIYERK